MIVLSAFLHHLAHFGGASRRICAAEGELTLWSARRLQVADMVLGIAAVSRCWSGLRACSGSRKARRITLQPRIFDQVFAFIIVALLSIVPTVEFLSWRKAVKAGAVPVVATAKLKRVRMIVHIELAAIVLILLCAAIMAKGG